MVEKTLKNEQNVNRVMDSILEIPLSSKTLKLYYIMTEHFRPKKYSSIRRLLHAAMNMVSCQWDIGFGSQNTILLSLERITCQSWDFFFFYYSQPSFCFFRNKPDIDVLDSKNYVAFWTDLESIRFCILNNLFPSITWLCAYCIQVWIILLCIKVGL